MIHGRYSGPNPQREAAIKAHWEAHKEQRKQWEAKADVTLEPEPDFPGDERDV